MHGAAHREHGKPRRLNTVIGQDLFAERLVFAEQQSAWVTPGVGLLHQFQIADDGEVIGHDAVEFFQQHERDVRFELRQRVSDRCQVVIDAQRQDFVPHFAQGRTDVEFGFPRVEVFLRHAVQRHRRFMTGADQHQYA